MENVHVIEPEPVQAVIELLEDLLERAKAGEICSIAGVCMSSTDGEFGEFYSDTCYQNTVQYIGYIRTLMMRFEREIPFD